MEFVYKVKFNTEEKEYLKELLKIQQLTNKEQLFKCDEYEDCGHCPFHQESTSTCMLGSFWCSLDYIAEAVEKNV